MYTLKTPSFPVDENQSTAKILVHFPNKNLVISSVDKPPLSLSLYLNYKEERFSH